MPSEHSIEARVDGALEAIEPARQSFHSALVATSGELKAMLDAGSSTAEERAERTAAELGAFAVGHIDVEKFASLQQTGEPLAVAAAPRLEAAARTLRGLLDAEDELYFVRVATGSDLRDAIADALGRAGRAFGAARTAELARAGSYDESLHGSWLDRFAPNRWNRRERDLAPPIVAEVDGGDLRPAGLADYLDGNQKIILVVRGPAPPAALARLITPGVTVIQSSDPADLDVMAGTEGPAIAALLTEQACRFVHLPDGQAGRGRLVVHHMPDEEPKRPIGTVSAFQQVDAMRHLASLASGWGLGASEAAAASGDGADGPAPTTAADMLAAWILRQADLQGTG
jgi:hypothetical protein